MRDDRGVDLGGACEGAVPPRLELLRDNAHAKPVDALVLADTLQAAHAAAIRAFGPLAEFRFLGMAPP